MTIKITLNGPIEDTDSPELIWTADIIVKDEETKFLKMESWMSDKGRDELLKVLPSILNNICQLNPLPHQPHPQRHHLTPLQ